MFLRDRLSDVTVYLYYDLCKCRSTFSIRISEEFPKSQVNTRNVSGTLRDSSKDFSRKRKRFRWRGMYSSSFWIEMMRNAFQKYENSSLTKKAFQQK